MRCLCWCSAVLLLAGCGGVSHHAATQPFAYDAAAPLDVQDAGVYASSARAVVHDISYTGAGGARVPAYLVVPRSSGPHPGVLLLHGSGGDRRDLLVEGALLGQLGAVAIVISQPNDATTYRPLVVDARRALDVLDARADVDPKRIGVVGFSLGAQTAAILAGADRRVDDAEIIAGRGTAVARFWLAKTHAALFFQAGTKDQVVPHAQLQALIDAAPGAPKVRWYPVGHELDGPIDTDLLAWQAAELRLR